MSEDEDEDEDEDRELPDPSDMTDDNEPDVIKCAGCGAYIVEDAIQCPICGEYLSADDRPSKTWTWLVWAIILIGVIWGLIELLKSFS